MDAKIDSINAAEKEWIVAQLQSASKFVEGFSPADSGQPMTLAALDRAFSQWLASNQSDTGLINAVINYVGVAFGQALVDGLELKWVIATDSLGSDLAVYGLPGEGDVLVYPASFVAKRWERRESDFLEAAYRNIAHDIEILSQQWQRPRTEQ